VRALNGSVGGAGAGTSPEGAAGPRARRTLLEGVTGSSVLGGPLGHRGCGYVVRVLGLRFSLRLRFLRNEVCFPRLFSDTYG
jgi:hypothetical protein